MDEPSNRPSPRPLAVVTGASSGIGYALAKVLCEQGYALVIAADEPAIVEAEQALRRMGGEVRSVQADLATDEGVRRLYEAAREAGPVEVLAANAGEGLGHAFLDQPWERVRHIVGTNVTGTLLLLQMVGRDMRERGQGRILITGSIAGLTPGPFNAVYNATKAFLDSFSFALRNELKDTGVTVTCLMPGATDTEFFERAEMTDTRLGQSGKDDPDEVARTGFEALMRGDGDVVVGLDNKARAALAAVAPRSALAEVHRGLAEPGSGRS